MDTKASTHLSPASALLPEKGVKPAYEAFLILKIGFVLAPILAGLDKFFNVLVDWTRYFSPVVVEIIPIGALLPVVAIVEIAAGVGVALKPRLFAYVVAAWLGAISLNLLLLPGFYDIALRDVGLALAALALGRLSLTYDSL